jgi:hypothetical protein
LVRLVTAGRGMMGDSPESTRKLSGVNGCV